MDSIFVAVEDMESLMVLLELTGDLCQFEEISRFSKLEDLARYLDEINSEYAKEKIHHFEECLKESRVLFCEVCGVDVYFVTKDKVVGTCFDFKKRG